MAGTDEQPVVLEDALEVVAVCLIGVPKRVVYWEGFLKPPPDVLRKQEKDQPSRISVTGTGQQESSIVHSPL
jgi:hypothetical protein